jgi:hypothetical protein
LFVSGVVINVEVEGEFKSRVDLFVFKFFVVEANPLEMNDEVVGYLLDEAALGDICFLLTRIALIV